MKPIFDDFVKTTSLNGIYFVYSSKSLVRKIFWITVFIFAWVGFIYHLTQLSIRYLNYEIQTTTRMYLPSSLPFPAVTVCNLSPVDKSKLEHSHFIQALLLLENVHNNDESNNRMKSMLSENCLCNMTDYKFETLTNTSCNLSVCYFKMITSFLIESNASDLSDVRDRMLLEFDDYEFGAHAISDFIVSITYDKKDVQDNETIDWYYSNRYGRCYTFGNLKEYRFNTTQPGENGGGLELILNINADNYIGLLSPQTGVKMDITDPDVQPLPDVNGVFLSPGYTTLVELQRKETIRLQAPYTTDCMDQYPQHLVPFLAEATHKYSHILCHKACKDYYTNKTCACTRNMDTPDAAGVTCYPLFHEYQWQCLKPFVNETNEYELSCGCRVSCNQITFSKVVSQAPWPTQAHKAVLSTVSKNENLKSLFSSHSLDYLRKNLVNVRVFYETFNVDVIEETPDYGLTSFLSDIGGITGLYLGMSLISLYELFEFISSVIRFYFHKYFLEWKRTFPSNAWEMDYRPRTASLISLKPTDAP